MIHDRRAFWRNLSIRYKAPALCGILLLPTLLLMTFITMEFHACRTQADTILLGYAQCIDFAKDLDFCDGDGAHACQYQQADPQAERVGPRY